MAPPKGHILQAIYLAAEDPLARILRRRRRLSEVAALRVRQIGLLGSLLLDALRSPAGRTYPVRAPAFPAALSMVLAGAAWSASAWAGPTIEPGYWSYQASTFITGAKSGDQCVRPDKIDEFLSGPHNRHYRCTYPVRQIADGAATFIGECVSKGGNRYRISLSGRYEPTAFQLNGHVAGTFVGLPISLPIEIKARRVSADCPAGSK